MGDILLGFIFSCIHYKGYTPTFKIVNKNLHSYLIQIFRSAIEILEIDIRGSPGPESQGPTPDNPVVSIRVTHR